MLKYVKRDQHTGNTTDEDLWESDDPIRSERAAAKKDKQRDLDTMKDDQVRPGGAPQGQSQG